MNVSWRDIQRIIVQQLGCDEEEVTLTATWADLGADSLDRVELVMGFETEFNISIADELAEQWQCVGDALAHFRAFAGYPYLFGTAMLVKKETLLTREQIQAMT